MKRSKSIVNIHIILGAICSLPILLTAITGIFLIVRSHTTFMQPLASKSSAVADLDQLISPQKIMADAQIPEGSINSIIYKPKKGITQVRTSNGFEYHTTQRREAPQFRR